MCSSGWHGLKSDSRIVWLDCDIGRAGTGRADVERERETTKARGGQGGKRAALFRIADCGLGTGNCGLRNGVERHRLPQAARRDVAAATGIADWGGRLKGFLTHTGNAAAFAGFADLDFELCALLLPGELAAHRRLGRDHQHGASVTFHLHSACKRADEVKRALASALQFDKRADIHRLLCGEFPQGEGFVALDGLHDFGSLLRLAAREIAGLQSARVVFVLRLVLFVGGPGMGFAG